MSSEEEPTGLVVHPVIPVQRQLDAYNRGDIDDFCANYLSGVRVRAFPGGEEVLSAPFRDSYEQLFSKNPNNHVELVSRMVHGRIVIDEEIITGREGQIEPLRVIAIYQVGEQLIENVWFLSKN